TKLVVSRDNGKTWTDVTPKDSPRLNMMNCIDVHPFQEGGAYLAATHYKFGDYQPYLYKTTDYGKTWTKIVNGIPANYYTRALRADPVRPGLLYAGTEWGMYISFDDGVNWQPFQLNLPITAIRDLRIHGESLIAATHGRSFWMIDDLGPVRQLDKTVANAPHHLYEPKPAYRMAQGGRRGDASLRLAGENHPNGVLFNFFVNDHEGQRVSLEIQDMKGQTIQTFSSDAKDKKQKLKIKDEENRFVWDMRYPGFKEFDGMILYSSPNRGPKAVPGNYRAILRVGEEESATSFEILADPRLETTQEDYEAQLAFLLKVRDRVSEAHQAMVDINSLREDINYFKGKLADKPDYEGILQLCDQLNKDMSVIENIST
ncbi:MAG: glycosyl hydrolase, partial [Bacteroidota bacterium]